MKKYRYLVLISILLINCSDEVGPNELIINVELSQDELVADGSSSLDMAIFLNQRADISLSKIKCSLSLGTFKSNDKNEVELTPIKKYNGDIIAEETIVSPITDSIIELKLDLHGIEKDIKIPTKRSEASSINLSANSFSLQTNFGSEITVTGVLKNANNKNVSTGHKVVIDEFLNGYATEIGHFREKILASNKESMISFIYAVGDIPPDQELKLIATILNQSGERTDINSSLTITIIKKE